MTRESKKSKKPAANEATYAERWEYPKGKHPVDAYLVGLGDDSERVTRAALDSVADIRLVDTAGLKFEAGKASARAPRRTPKRHSALQTAGGTQSLAR